MGAAGCSCTWHPKQIPGDVLGCTVIGTRLCCGLSTWPPPSQLSTHPFTHQALTSSPHPTPPHPASQPAFIWILVVTCLCAVLLLTLLLIYIRKRRLMFISSLP